MITNKELKKIEQKIATLEKGAEKTAGKVDYKKGLLLLDIKKRKLYRTDKCTSFEAYCGQEHKFKMDVTSAKFTANLSEFKCNFWLKKGSQNLKMAAFLERILAINLRQFREVDTLKTGHKIAIFEKLFESEEKLTAKIVADCVKNFTGTYEEVDFTDDEIEQARVFLLNYSPGAFMRQLRQEENKAKIESNPPIIDDLKYSTIVIDPPWNFKESGGTDVMGRSVPSYSTMSIQELCDMNIPSDNDCHIYLWITNTALPNGFKLLDAWGFRYVTMLTWVKPSFGMGNYFRGQTEHVLFGVKGSQPLKVKNASTVFSANRGPNGHSSKPLEFLEMVESWSPGPYLEIFSREPRDGWSMRGENNGI